MNLLDLQTVIDVALVATGDASKAFDIALENGISITDNVDEVNVAVVDNKTTSFYSINKCKPATGYTEEPYKIFDFTFDETFE